MGMLAPHMGELNRLGAVQLGLPKFALCEARPLSAGDSRLCPMKSRQTNYKTLGRLGPADVIRIAAPRRTACRKALSLCTFCRAATFELASIPLGVFFAYTFAPAEFTSSLGGAHDLH
jgi:hypothetical protein